MTLGLLTVYKHSVLKRDDGDHITIWVDNSYESIEGPFEEPAGLSKRQSARVAGNSDYYNNGGQSNCGSHDMRFLTSKASPFSGGALALARWGENHRGRWYFDKNKTWKTLAIGGSNAGHNAQYRANPSLVYRAETWVGTHDMGHCARHTYDDYRREMEKGVWRAAGYGWMTCTGFIGDNVWFYHFRFNWELISSTATV